MTCFTKNISRLEENFDFLNKVNDAAENNEGKLYIILKRASNEEVATIVEIAVNLLSFNINCTNALLKEMGKYADFYRSLNRVRTYNGARQKLIKGEPEAFVLLLSFVIEEIDRLLK